MATSIMIGLSGGPSTAINATLAGIIRRAAAAPEIDGILGAVHGIQGVLAEEFVDLRPCADEEQLRILRQTPAMAIGSCRKKLVPEEYPQIEEILTRKGIGLFLYVGGNDSMDTVLKLSRYFQERKSPIRVVGVPKTIDNDLPACDHSPGFGSAAKYLYHTMSEIIRDSVIYPVQNVVIAEIMGRDSGWLTLSAGLPRFLGKTHPQILAIPEVPFVEEDFLEQIRRIFRQGDRTVVCAVSEGIRDPQGTYVGMAAKSGKSDVFGHQYLSGVGKYLEALVTREIGCKVRSIELNVMQRCAAHLASEQDLREAEAVGAEAVELALRGESGVTLALQRKPGAVYAPEITAVPVERIANQVRNVPEEWFQLEDPQVREEIRAYLLPLIQGEPEQLLNEHGLPKYLELPMEGLRF